MSPLGVNVQNSKGRLRTSGRSMLTSHLESLVGAPLLTSPASGEAPSKDPEYEVGSMRPHAAQKG